MTPEECNDRIEQLILDENEIVTYKLLSKELKIHVNEAKKCLYDFLKVHKSKDDVKLFAYYFLSGIIVKDGMELKKIVVVSENNLEKMKNDFKEVKSCHLYSLNKGGCQDEAALYNSQSWCKKWAEEHKEYSSIKHPNLIIKEPSLKKLVVKKVDANIRPAKSSTVKPLKKESTSLFQNNSAKNSVNSKLESDESKSLIDETEISKTSDNNAHVNGIKPNNKPSTSKTTLGSLWQKLEDKSKKGKKGDSTPEDSKPNNNAKAAKKTVGQNNIMSLFSKQAEKKASNSVQLATNGSAPSETKTHVAENMCDNKVSQTVKKETVCKNGSQQNVKRKLSQRRSKRSAKPVNDNESDEEVKPKAKKHRRICTMDDSDSESESEEAVDKAQRSILTSEEPNKTSIHMSDDNEEPIPPTPPVLLSKGKKKVWKTVQKTFEDEDGFLVAKQEKVLVSASDSDEDPIGSKNSASEVKPKQDTFTYRKQTSLTSFFK